MAASVPLLESGRNEEEPGAEASKVLSVFAW
jgi:hypothetical protein